MISTLSTRLKDLRSRRHLSQNQVAEILGVTRSAIWGYENDIRRPEFEVLVRLANLYRVSTDYLLGKTNNCSIDLEGLNDKDIALIGALVSILAEKNEQLKKQQ